MKKLLRLFRTGDSHWVGDGFPVRTMFSYSTPNIEASPFLLMDYAGPAEFLPAEKPRGVSWHPHRGFETVTLLYQGEVEHHDTAGHGGLIGPGDVQWMTAAHGLLHEEMHSAAFTRQGGTFEAIQLWVNLPAQYKMIPPRYQTITDSRIPAVRHDDSAAIVRVIAGEYRGVKGPASTFTPVNLWDMRLPEGQILEFDVPEDYTTILFTVKGGVEINGDATANDAEVAFFERKGKHIRLAAHKNATLLLMNGEPINEPVAGYGPFVMNTDEEIRQAIADYNAGRFQ